MTILVERDGAVVRLTLSHPERRNALTADDFADLRRLLDAETAANTVKRPVRT